MKENKESYTNARAPERIPDDVLRLFGQLANSRLVRNSRAKQETWAAPLLGPEHTQYLLQKDALLRCASSASLLAHTTLALIGGSISLWLGGLSSISQSVL